MKFKLWLATQIHGVAVDSFC